jgi:hypothetical protein
MSSGIDRSRFCRGGGGACECEEFRWQNDGKPICYECDHGISKHPQAGAATSKTMTTTERAELPPPPPPPPPDPSSSLRASTRTPGVIQPTLMDIFSNLTEPNLKPDRSLLTQTAEAQAEAVATFGSHKPKVAALPRVISGTRKVS